MGYKSSVRDGVFVATRTMSGAARIIGAFLSFIGIASTLVLLIDLANWVASLGTHRSSLQPTTVTDVVQSLVVVLVALPAGLWLGLGSNVITIDKVSNAIELARVILGFKFVKRVFSIVDVSGIEVRRGTVGAADRAILGVGFGAIGGRVMGQILAAKPSNYWVVANMHQADLVLAGPGRRVWALDTARELAAAAGTSFGGLS